VNLVIAVLGLGEAGSVIAHDLVAAGVVVRGYDPAVAAGAGLTDTPGEAEAARGADLVLSVNSAKAAVDAFRPGGPACAPVPCGPTSTPPHRASNGSLRASPKPAACPSPTSP